MDVNAQGIKSSEFWMLIIVVVLLIASVVVENGFGWKIPEQVWTILLGLLGGSGIYAAGRSYVKGQAANAQASIEVTKLKLYPPGSMESTTKKQK